MKRLVVVLFCMVFAVTAMNAQDKKSKGKETVTFQVDGMDCNNCVKKIEKNIAFEKGVTDLKCDLATKTAMVTYKSDKTCPASLSEAFKKIGLEAVPVADDDCCDAKKADACENKEAGCCKDKKGCTENKNCCQGK